MSAINACIMASIIYSLNVLMPDFGKNLFGIIH